MRQQLLETRINKLRKNADTVAAVLGNVSTRVPGVPPENLDDLHKHIKRGELRRVLVACIAISSEAASDLPDSDAVTQADRIARRAARASKRKTKRKTAKKKTGG